jgi:hypothetical protein
MTSDGTRKEIPVVTIGPGEAHLQNEIVDYKCYVCHAPEQEDMALLRINDKRMGFACLRHSGVVQEFVRQYGRPPLGWEVANKEKTH